MKSKKMAFVVFALILSLLPITSFAHENHKEITSLVLNGQEYLFSTNLYEAIELPVNNESGIKGIFENYEGVCIIYNESSEQDNAYFSTVLYNLVFKVKRYYTLQGRAFEMLPCNEYNLSDIIIPILFIKGPNTGATENSITINGTNIVLQGTNATGIQMAGDKLALIVLGITELESFEDKGIPAQSFLIIAVGIIFLFVIIYLIYRENKKKEQNLETKTSSEKNDEIKEHTLKEEQESQEKESDAAEDGIIKKENVDKEK